MATEIPSTMRASQYISTAGGLDKNLSVNASAPLPKAAHSLGKDQTLVRINYSALNPIDYKLPEAPLLGRLLISKPASPSMDFAGRVVATSRSDLKPGQAVFGKTEPPAFGALAEYAVVGREGCVPLPEGVDARDAGCIGVAGLTAYQCIVPNVKAGDKVLINGGSGGTGTFGIQFAKAKGCYVVATCSGPNVELCKMLGADEVIDYRTQNVAETLSKGGNSFDLIVDNVGSDELYWPCHNYLKAGKKFVAVGGGVGLATVKSLLTIFLLPGFLGGGQRKYHFLAVQASAVDFAQIGQWIAEGKVKPVIDETFLLEDAGKAFAKLKTGRTRGKLSIEVSK